MSVVVGVDAGTGSARGVAIDPGGCIRCSAEASYAGTALGQAGYTDATAWLGAVQSVLRSIAAGVRGADAVTAVCVGGQSPTSIDAETGRAVTVLHPVGLELDPIAQHYAQRDVLRSLGGGGEPRQLWDWVCERLGAPAAQGRWPGDAELEGYGTLARTGDVVGSTRGDAGLAEGVALVAGAQDAYLALWAAGVTCPGRGLDPGGRTGGLAVGAPAGTAVAGLWTVAGAATGVDIVGGPVNAHGLTLEWLAGLTGLSAEELLKLAAEVAPGAGGLLFLPYLNGERAPRWNSRLRGELAGISLGTGAAELARAVLEGTALGLAHIAEVLRSAGVLIETVVCAGSPARSRLWCEIKAAALEVTVESAGHVPLAAYGAALAAGAGAGWWPRPGAGGDGSWPRPPMEPIHAQPEPLYREALQRFIALGDQMQERAPLRGHREQGGPT